MKEQCANLEVSPAKGVKRRGSRMWLFCALVLSCGANISCGGNPVGGGEASQPFVFKGLVRSGVTYDETRGTYTLTWERPAPNMGKYYVYKRFDGEAFDFTKPLAVTDNTTLQTGDLRFEPKSCMVVRYAIDENSPQDKNTNEVCTWHAQLSFSGLASMAREEDGNYLLKWDKIPLNAVVYEIFTGSQVDPTAVSFSNPAWETTENYFHVQGFALGEKRCFVVRFTHGGVSQDKNTKTLCTDDNLLTDFSGVANVQLLDTSVVKVHWKQSTHLAVTGYTVRVYDSNHQEMAGWRQYVGQVPSVSETDALVEKLAKGVYFFGVRARDKAGHEDLNEKVVCIQVQGAVSTVPCMFE